MMTRTVPLSVLERAPLSRSSFKSQTWPVTLRQGFVLEIVLVLQNLVSLSSGVVEVKSLISFLIVAFASTLGLFVK